MLIDPNKVNLAEADIEEYLWQHPELLVLSHPSDRRRVDHWIGRQYEVPSGIIDLWGVTTLSEVIVVEVKKGAINAQAIAQVCRYALDIERVISRFATPGNTFRVVVGTSIDRQAMFECHAAGVDPFIFRVQMHLQLFPQEFSAEVWDQLDERYNELAKSESMQHFQDFCQENIPF